MSTAVEATVSRGGAPLPDFADVAAAAARLAGHAVKTPLLESAALNDRVGGRVLIKPEVLQRTGSFKFRGAFNKISQLGPEARAAGVVAYSSGNHAQGVASAARICGLPATIVMPRDAPAIKIENTRGHGAEVVLYERASQSREAAAEAIARERGAVIVRPYDDPDIIAGQGTCGLEIAGQARDLGLVADALLVCCGGGGLTAGCTLAMREASPSTALYSVEPAGFDDTARSLEAGEHVHNEPEARSICDALLSPTPGRLTFEINRRELAGGLVVSDDEVRAAMGYAFRELKLVVEPGGAVALAAVLSGKIEARGRVLAVVLSGGNVDPQAYAEIIAG